MTRRVVTAREQVGMMGPWKTAGDDLRWIPTRDKGGDLRLPAATQKLIDSVRGATGVNLDVENTGGRNYVLSGRLEDGSWVVATDGGDGATWWDTADRHRHEAEHGPMGWDIGFYHNTSDAHGDYWDDEPYHWHSDEHAGAHELPSVLANALASMPHGAKLDRKPGETPESGKKIDYENLVNPRDDLDEDYGDIFGGGK